MAIRYWIIVLFFLSLPAQANSSVIELIDAFEVSGLSLKSTSLDFDKQIKSQPTSFHCEIQNNPERKDRHRIHPKNSYRNCIAQDATQPSNWKRFMYKSVNDTTKILRFEGSDLPIGNENLVTQIEQLYKKLAEFDLSDNELKYSSNNIEGASSPVFIQELLVKQKELCGGFPVTVSLASKVMKDLSKNKIMSVAINLKRDEYNQCDRPKAIQKNQN